MIASTGKSKGLPKAPGAVKKAVGNYGKDKEALIQVLLDLQAVFNWLPPEVLREVSEQLDVPIAQVYRIASYYKAFSLQPRGRHIIKVCMGTACQVRGSPQVLNIISAMLDMKQCGTSADMRFTLETVNCLGCCAMGPVVAVDAAYHSKPSTAELRTIFEAAE